MQENSVDFEEKYDAGKMLVRDSVILVKEGKIAYAYTKEQVDEINNILKNKYNIDTETKEIDFYFTLKKKK